MNSIASLSTRWERDMWHTGHHIWVHRSCQRNQDKYLCLSIWTFQDAIKWFYQGNVHKVHQKL